MGLIHDIVVIGGGFWGSVITVQLRQHHPDLAITCLDSGEPGFASRAAGGLLRSEWLDSSAFARIRPEWWGPAHTRACLEWVEEGLRAGWIKQVEEARVDRRWLAPRKKMGLHLVDCAALLTQGQARTAHVLRLERKPAGWVLRGTSLIARTLVLAAGVGCDLLLRASGLPILGVQSARGEALLGAGALTSPVTYSYRLPGDTRTRSGTARAWAGGLRIGDTWEDDGLQLAELREFGARVGFGETQIVSGARPVLPRLTVEEISSGLVVATGGHRSGLISSAGAALRVCELVEYRSR